MHPKAFIVGCGRIAGGFNETDESAVLTHAVAYRRLGVEIAGCCDRDPGRAGRFAARWGVPHSGTALPNLLEAVRPDVVSLCTPPSDRMSLVEAVLACPSVQGVLLEKPLAGAPTEARELSALIRRSGRPVLVNYFRAFDPLHRRLEEEVRGGSLTGPCEGTARYYGRATENASHWIERALALFGPARGARCLDGAGEAPLFELDLERGRLLFLPSRGCEYAPFELDLFFPRRRVRLVDSEGRREQFVSRPDPQYPDYFTLIPDDAWPGCHPSRDPLLLSVREMLAAARGESVRWIEVLDRAAQVVEILDQVGAAR